MLRAGKTLRVLAVTNMYPTPQAPASGTFIEQQVKGLREIGTEVEVLLIDRIHDGYRAYMGIGDKVRTKIVEFRPDLVHVMYGGIMADIVTRRVNDLPVIVSFCGSDLLGENLNGLLRKMIASYGVLASHRAARRAAGVIVKSNNLRDALPADLKPRKIRILPNGIDSTRFRPLDRTECRDRLHWAGDGFHVLFPANGGDPVKRPELARAALETLGQSGIVAEMHLLRGIPHADVPIWINASDVVLLTSRHEGSPNIIKEALACDVPVVSVDVGDVAQRIAGVSGCYLAEPQPAALGACLLQVHASPRRVKGRDVIGELTLERTAQHLKTFYDATCSTWRSRGEPACSPWADT